MFGDVFTSWFLIPFLIFLARILDVSIGTIRIILIAKGLKKIAPILGFLESFIWIIAVSQIMLNLNNFYYYFAYSMGFATGTYFGIVLEEKLSLGFVIVRVITYKDATELVRHLRESNHPATVIDAEGQNGDVKVIFLVIKRSSSADLIQSIKHYNPNAFYTIEDVKFVSGGVFPSQTNPMFAGKYFRFITRKK
ncbi:MAG: DUF2179 domain-containing protein [Candidatus Kapabacteria bacterium]|nr:DUF2179 domain-containing protein [Ignavibacteriota bacterium]MCW5885938.1 DUF2179 domain-containing protein [Candidatus Kapabacteria bacterium]